VLASPRYPFAAWAVKGAPDDPGVYALYAEEKLLCIGTADGGRSTIRVRLLALLERAGDLPAITHYQWEITSRPEETRARYLRELGRRVIDCERLVPPA
jgi:hypothetical protein